MPDKPGGRESRLQKAVKEARETFLKLKHKVKGLEPYPNESHAEFEKRLERERFRRDHAREVKDHLVKKLEVLRKQKAEMKPDPDGDGLSTWDGYQVAAWMIPWLEKSRNAGWDGQLSSGYRTPEYSESLCYNMCGKPACPGLCAGRASKHSEKVYPGGAIDVYPDYANFERIQYQIGSPLRNYLSQDLVHFSTTGY